MVDAADKLVFKYEFDRSHFDKKYTPDDFGYLSVEVETGCFKGSGGFWVQWQDLVELGAALAIHPISPDAPLVAQWGYNHQENDDLIIYLSINPENQSGNLVASIEIADHHAPHKRLRTLFRTTYPAIHMFGRDIAKMMDHKAKEAVLFGL